MQNVVPQLVQLDFSLAICQQRRIFVFDWKKKNLVHLYMLVYQCQGGQKKKSPWNKSSVIFCNWLAQNCSAPIPEEKKNWGKTEKDLEV